MADHVPNLGEEPGEFARRDAVHVAVAPVVAGEDIGVGQTVWIDYLGFAFSGVPLTGVAYIGIVDPFRVHYVNRGERFWLFLFPGTITGLRHVWSHPAFTHKPNEAS